MQLEVARTFGDVERLAPLWDQVPWQREEAEREFFLARAQERPDTVAPFAVIAVEGGKPVGALSGRIDVRDLPASIGYRRLYRPRVRLLHVLDGGIYAGGALDEIVASVGDALRHGEFEAVALPFLATDSPVLSAFESLAGPVRRRRGRVQPRRRLTLPTSYDDYLASLSHKTRKGIRRDARALAERFGDALSVEIVRGPAGFDRLVAGAERVAQATYQRALGSGFADTPERRAATKIGLERGWIRGYLLSSADAPIAFWICSVYRGTLLLQLTGYDQSFAELRVGLYLLLRVIEDAIADPEIHTVDFGPGDAGYKRQLSNESHLERDLLVFAPTVRGVRVNMTRNAILGAAALARRALDAAHLTDRVRTGWRGRLRSRR